MICVEFLILSFSPDSIIRLAPRIVRVTGMQSFEIPVSYVYAPIAGHLLVSGTDSDHACRFEIKIRIDLYLRPSINSVISKVEIIFPFQPPGILGRVAVPVSGRRLSIVRIRKRSPKSSEAAIQDGGPCPQRNEVYPLGNCLGATLLLPSHGQ